MYSFQSVVLGTLKDGLIPLLNHLTKGFEPRHEIYNNVAGATSKGSDQPAHTRSLIRTFASRLNIL